MGGYGARVEDDRNSGLRSPPLLIMTEPGDCSLHVGPLSKMTLKLTGPCDSDYPITDGSCEVRAFFSLVAAPISA